MEQLINFETAKMAKEAGFKEFMTNLCYDDFDGKLDTMPEHRKNWNDEKYRRSIAAPQSVVQKWLRDKHGIHVISKAYNDEELNQILWEDVTIDFEDYWQEYSTYTFYHSYEESLEAGLQEALKLVISKNSQGGN